MPTIIYSPSTQLQQIDDFPDDCERSIKGSLHIRPGATADVSEGEAAHLKKSGVVFRELPVPPPPKEADLELPEPKDGDSDPMPGKSGDQNFDPAPQEGSDETGRARQGAGSLQPVPDVVASGAGPLRGASDDDREE